MRKKLQMNYFTDNHFGKTWTKLALATASACMISAAPASAADFGGDCCADLEERVAVLEATTARKGNRKVSLTISGWVTKQVWMWDDGDESDAYVADTLEDVGTRLHFDGKAQINHDWSAGYAIRLNIKTANSFQQTQDDDDAGAGINVLNSNVWIKSEQYGKVTLGRQSQASDNTFVDLSGAGSVFAANLVIFDGASMFLRPKGGNSGIAGRSSANWSNFGHCFSLGVGIFSDCFGGRTNAVRYDSPTIAGFVLSTSWGEDDFWDVALRYSGEFGDFKTGFAASYTNVTDSTKTDGSQDAELWQIAGSVLHQPTGLFFSGIYNEEEPQDVPATYSDSYNFHLKAGIRTSLNSLGKTVFYGEYGRAKDAFGGIADAGDACGAFDGLGGSIDGACANAADTSVLITGSEFSRWGLGVVQEIDAASMAVWVKYKQYELTADFLDAGSNTSGKQDFENLHMFAVGGVIFF